MSYYLAQSKNARKLTKDALDDELSTMNFKYNTKHKYWYRITANDIIQFVGFFGDSGGYYNLNFLCQPIFVPMDMSKFCACRGDTPSLLCVNVAPYLKAMEMTGISGHEKIPVLNNVNGYYQVGELLHHMRASFNVVVKPYMEEAQSVESCLKAHIRRKNIMSVLWPSDEGRREYLMRTDDITVLSLLALHHYCDVENIIEEDRIIREKSGMSYFLYDLYLQYLNNDTKVDELLRANTATNLKLLRADGFQV